MKYLHIIPPSIRMMNGYLTMLEKYFPQEEHYVLIKGQVGLLDSPLLFYNNVTLLPQLGNNKIERYFLLKKYLESFDCVIFHSFKPNIKWTIFLFLNKNILKKSIWVMWGIDLYTEKILKKLSFMNLETYLKNKFKYVVAIFETDIQVYISKFNKNNVFCAPYGFIDDRFDEMDMNISSNKESRNNDLVNILVGHNGFIFNNHIDTLNNLEKFKNKNIELYLPVSYGNSKLLTGVTYVDALIQFGKLKFKEKITFNRKMMSNSDYTKFLSKIDIAIFNSHRQNGLGNILQLLYMNKKIYLSDKNPIYKYLKNKEITIFNANDIKTCDFEQLIKTTEKDENINKKWVREKFSIHNSANIWKLIFSCMSNEIKFDEAIEKNKKFL